MTSFLRRAVLGIALMTAGPLSAACEQLTVTDAWIREAPPGAAAVAAYMRLANDGQAPIVIDAVSSPAFRHGMLHETIADGGSVRMRHVEQLGLAPGEHRDLAPGGLHLMLMHPLEAAPVAGATVEVVLGCGETSRSLQLPVRRE